MFRQKRKNNRWNSAHIRIDALTIGYESLSAPVLTKLNCVFDAGKIHAIVGPSGSGKSTLVNTILGLHPAMSGALSAYRIMPSMTRLNGHVMAMRSNYYVINVIEAALNSWAENPDNPNHPDHVPAEAKTTAGTALTFGSMR